MCPCWTSHVVAQPPSHSFPQLTDKSLREYMNTVEDTKGQRSLSVPEFICTIKENATCSLSFSKQTVSSSVLARLSWASKAKLNTWWYQKKNCRFKETIIYDYHQSTTLIPINFQTRLGFGAPSCLSASHNEAAYVPSTAKRRDWRPKDDEGDVRCFTLPQMYSRLVWSVENGSR